MEEAKDEVEKDAEEEAKDEAMEMGSEEVEAKAAEEAEKTAGQSDEADGNVRVAQVGKLVKPKSVVSPFECYVRAKGAPVRQAVNKKLKKESNTTDKAAREAEFTKVMKETWLELVAEEQRAYFDQAAADRARYDAEIK